MIRFTWAVIVVISASLLKAASVTAYSVFRRTTYSIRIMNAGPAVNADARKRGPSNALFQNGRAGRPGGRDAVTRRLLPADMTEMCIRGRYFRLAGGLPA